jgi:hypothetical protein
MLNFLLACGLMVVMLIFALLTKRLLFSICVQVSCAMVAAAASEVFVGMMLVGINIIDILVVFGMAFFILTRVENV